MTSSTLLLEKNQKYPVSPVSGTAVPTPLVPWEGTRQDTSILNLPLFRQSVKDPATHGPSSGTSGTAPRVEPAGSVLEDGPPAKADVSATLARVPETLL